MGRMTKLAAFGAFQRRLRYEALPSQLNFNNAKERFKGFSGPVGSGKSRALCQEVVRQSYLNPGRVGLLGAPTFRMLRDATITALLEVLAENEIRYVWNKVDHSLTFLDTGSVVLFRSVREADRLRGTNLAWFGVDELTYCEEAVWTKLEARLRDPQARRKTGFGVWTPKGRDWVYRRFIAKKLPGYRTVRAKPFENRYVLEGNPEYYEALKHSYDEDFFRQEALGEYLSGSGGAVYKRFDRERNVAAAVVDVNKPLLWAFDFNVDPMCAVVAQRDGDFVRVVNEIVLARSGTQEMCEEFLERYAGEAREVVIYGDASGNSRSTRGSSDYDIVRRAMNRRMAGKYRIQVPSRNPSVMDRVSLVNAKLLNAAGATTLTVDARCKGLIADLEELEFKTGSSVIDKDKDKDRSHLSDALGYLIWQEFEGKRSAGEQGRRII